MVACQLCKKPLRSIGNQRKNGRYFEGNKSNDWKGRKYHKQCHKIVWERRMLRPEFSTEEMARLKKSHDEMVQKMSDYCTQGCPE